LAGDHDRIIGAFHDETLIGIGGIMREPFEKCRHKALLYGMSVSPTAIGQGVGRAIVKPLIAEACDFVISLHLTLMADNDRARALYKWCGFMV
jgi:RimJ/RimL family protein N-acetyltransferase